MSTESWCVSSQGATWTPWASIFISVMGSLPTCCEVWLPTVHSAGPSWKQALCALAQSATAGSSGLRWRWGWAYCQWGWVTKPSRDKLQAVHGPDVPVDTEAFLRGSLGSQAVGRGANGFNGG